MLGSSHATCDEEESAEIGEEGPQRPAMLSGAATVRPARAYHEGDLEVKYAFEVTDEVLGLGWMVDHFGDEPLLPEEDSGAAQDDPQVLDPAQAYVGRMLKTATGGIEGEAPVDKVDTLSSTSNPVSAESHETHAGSAPVTAMTTLKSCKSSNGAEAQVEACTISEVGSHGSLRSHGLRPIRSLERPLDKEHLVRLTGFATGASSPSYRHCEAWVRSVSGGQQRPLFSLKYLPTTCLVLALNWVLSAVLSGLGLLTAYTYREVFDWHGARNQCIIFGLLGGIFTGWNIAQYASYTIQTTGHLTLRQHWRAICSVGPVILPCNLVGWALGGLVVATPLADLSTAVHVLIIAGPPIAFGIAVKTAWKLRYLHKFSRTRSPPIEDSLEGSPGVRMDLHESAACLKAQDSLERRILVEEAAEGCRFECPFSSVSAGLWGKHFSAPFMCFLWTVVYVIGLRLGYVRAAHQDFVLKHVAQAFLFMLSLLATAAGMHLLTKWVKASSGYFGYNHQMLVAFVVIYGLVSDVQIRLGIVKMDGYMRLFCTMLQPLYFSTLRAIMTRDWMKSSVATEDTDILRPSNPEPRLVITCMGIMVTQNVSAVLLAGTTCLFEEHSDVFSLGLCEKGFWMQILRDAGATWAFDVVSIYTWTRNGMPVLYFFSLLDPFLTVAAVLVVYMCTTLALLTACIN